MSFFKKFRKNKPTYGILVVGDSNVGKTWLQQCYRGLRGPSMIDKISQRTYANMVVAAIEGISANLRLSLSLDPTPTWRRIYPCLRRRYPAVWLSFSATMYPTASRLKAWQMDRCRGKQRRRMLKYLAACKCDRTHDVERGEAEKFARYYLLESFTRPQP